MHRNVLEGRNGLLVRKRTCFITWTPVTLKEKCLDSRDGSAESCLDDLSQDMWHFCSSHFSQCNRTDRTVLLPSCTWTVEGFLEWRGLLPCVCTAAGPRSCPAVPQYTFLAKRGLQRSIVPAGQCCSFSSTHLYALHLAAPRKHDFSLGTRFTFPAYSREMKTEVFVVKCLYVECLKYFFFLEKNSFWSILLTATGRISGLVNRQIAFPPNLASGCNKLRE